MNNEHFPKVTLAALIHYQSYRKDVNQVIHGYPLLPGLNYFQDYLLYCFIQQIQEDFQED